MNPQALASVMVNDAIAGSCGRVVNMHDIDKVVEIGACREWLMDEDYEMPWSIKSDFEVSGCGFGFCLRLLGRDRDSEMQDIGRLWRECHDDIMLMLKEEYDKVTTSQGRPKRGEKRGPDSRHLWKRRKKMRDAIAYTTQMIEESRKYYV